MILQKCIRKCCQNRPNCVLWSFLLAILPTIGALLYVYFSSNDFYSFWRFILTLNAVFFINCVWFALLCPASFFLLHFKVKNKAIATLYSVALLSVIICCAACILMSQLKHANLDDSDNFVTQSIKEYFAEKEDIPTWMHEIQSEKKCCGFSGPKDWKQFIYPLDKPAVEDFPLSCCIVKVMGCNLVMGELSKTSGKGKDNMPIDLSRWIHINGCRKHVQILLDSILNYVAYGSIVVLITSIIVLVLYWWLLVEFIKEQELVDEIIQELERNCSETSHGSSYTGSRSRRHLNHNESVSTSNKNRTVANFNDDEDDGVGDIVYIGRRHL